MLIRIILFLLFTAATASAQGLDGTWVGVADAEPDSGLPVGVRLTLEERDHLLLLAGHTPPPRAAGGRHVSPGLMRILDRLADTPAQVMTTLGETLVQTPPARALFGDETRFAGSMASVGYRWFTDAASRGVYPDEDHPVRLGFVAHRLDCAGEEIHRELPVLRGSTLPVSREVEGDDPVLARERGHLRRPRRRVASRSC